MCVSENARGHLGIDLMPLTAVALVELTVRGVVLRFFHVPSPSPSEGIRRP
jgi:hypothetical protein